MRNFWRVLWAAILLVWFLAGCSGRGATLSPTPSPASAPRATVSIQPVASPVKPSAVPATSTASPIPAKPIPADTTAPNVSLAADLTEVPWLGQTTVHVTAQDARSVVNVTVLLDDQVLATADAGDLSFDLIPGALDGVAPGRAYMITARAADAAGNVGQATLLVRFGVAPATPTLIASATATPAASPTASAAVTSYRVTEISLLTYPYAPFLRQTTDPSASDYPVTTLDRPAYEASNPQPAPVKYRLIVLENRYLRLGILPDLGGRIYECMFKPTGHNEFYSNPVVKPTTWGPPSPPYPAGAAWWLGVGGLEWNFPVEEHGYEWGTRWGFDHVTQPNGGVMVTLFTRNGPQAPYAVVDVILPPDTTYFVVQPRIINPWGAPFKFKWWDNAMLAPGAANQPGADLRFIFPAAEVTVHSTGDAGLPATGQPMAWPVYGGRDLSRLGNWAQYLGAFQRPAARGGFMGVYDIAADEGMLRIYPSDVAKGAKLFAAGWRAPLDWHTWTDDGSGYVELHGGLEPTFADWHELPPGGEVTWSEIWYPVAGIGGVTYADEDGALALIPAGGRLKVALLPTTAARGKLTVSLPGMEPVIAHVELSPARPFLQELALPDSVPAQGQVAVTLVDAGGQILFSYRGAAQLR